MGRREDKRSIETVGNDVLVKERDLLAFVCLVVVIERELIQPGRLRDLAERKRPGHDESDEHRGHQVQEDSHPGRHDQHDGIAPGRARRRGEGSRLPPSGSPSRSAPAARAASGIPPTRGAAAATAEQDRRVAHRRQAGGAPERTYDRRPRDRRRRRHAAEQRATRLATPLTEQLPIGVVSLTHAHAVGDRRGQEALQRGQRCDRHGRRREPPDVDRAEVGEARGVAHGGSTRSSRPAGRCHRRPPSRARQR